jgi:hypothetical protein
LKKKVVQEFPHGFKWKSRLAREEVGGPERVVQVAGKIKGEINQ